MNRLLRIAAALLLLGVVGFLAWRFWASPERSVRSKAVVRREVALRVLGEHLGAQHAGGRAVVFSNPFSQKPGQPAEVYDFEAAALAGLKAGWGAKLELEGVLFPELRPGALENPGSVPIDPQTTTPLSFLTAPKAWDALWAKHPQADVVVSLIGLPLDLYELELWRRPSAHLALLLPDLRMLGGADGVRKALNSGKLSAMVLNRPGAPPESAPIARDYRAEFAQRFMLVTARDFEQVVAAYPQLF